MPTLKKLCADLGWERIRTTKAFVKAIKEMKVIPEPEVKVIPEPEVKVIPEPEVKEEAYYNLTVEWDESTARLGYINGNRAEPSFRVYGRIEGQKIPSIRLAHKSNKKYILSFKPGKIRKNYIVFVNGTLVGKSQVAVTPSSEWGITGSNVPYSTRSIHVMLDEKSPWVAEVAHLMGKTL